ncbi:MAG TPA: LamG domain-containing protein [Steroidobacteraceae bacterium]|nr:LamG domain-containing protein [Steroidobacteraceae bacterium]
MKRKHLMYRTEPTFAGVGTLRVAAALALAAVLAACTGGGAPTAVNQVTSNTTTANAYTGPAPQTADIQAFQINLWQNIRVANRCGGCHHEGGQSPMFARSDDVNLAYQAALPLVDASNPSQSTLVLRVGSGHNCWVADPNACAQTMLTWIDNWLGGGSAVATKITLTPPPVQSVGGSKLFPADSTAFQQLIWQPILTQFCSNCHRPDSSTAQAPYFASSDPNQAYLAAQAKINLDVPSESRFVERLQSELHHCWATTPGGPPDCPGSAAKMLAAITAYANTIPTTQVDPSLVISKALTMEQGTIAAGGSRYEANIVAKYMFETGTGNTAYDTSGVSPSADLTLYGPVTWAGGWGINVPMGGKAQASTSSSQKIAQLIQATGEYSIEVWAAPANVTQTDAYILSYSGSDKTRDMTLAQHMQQYEGMTRSTVTDSNGSPPLLTAAANMNAQAALQHIVLTYDPINGQKLYVNGVFTGDVDPNKGAALSNWDNTFALVLGSEVTGKEQWTGLIKFAAIHSRALTPTQIQQNFAAGVGQSYYLLFDVSSLSGIAQSYILMQASQYDSYSYLFNKPTFFSLNSKAAPSSLVIKGLRIGMNGSVPTVGQSYSTLSTTVGPPGYTAANGQLLSNVGAVLAVDAGMASDMFFLSFDQFGSHQHVFVEPTYTLQPPVPSTTPQPDVGVATFERIYHAMSNITGVPFTNATVAALYNTEQQSMPAGPLVTAFVSSEQTAISQLAQAYCGQLVGTQALRDNFFGTGLDASIGATAGSFFGSSSSPNTANINLVVTPLVNATVGTAAHQQTAAGMTTELNHLLTLIPTLPGEASTTVSKATQAACTAALGSAAVVLQ